MTAPYSHPDPKDCLFHYTSAGGLKGILKDRCIWATDSAFLNDSSEIFYAGHAVERHIENLIHEIEVTNPVFKSSDWHRMHHLISAKDALELLNDAEEWAPTASMPHIINGATYVSCFTEEPDQLSQWRGYGGRGYSVGFTRDGLNNMVIEGVSSLTASAGPVTQVNYGQPGLEKLRREVSDWFATRPVTSQVSVTPV